MSILRHSVVISISFLALSASAADRTADARDASVREAQAARVEAKRGGLTDVNDAQRERNRFARCDAHQGEDREFCIRRMSGEGTVTGSVEGGGLLRELKVTEPAK